jgi:hypothetical protein
MGESSLSDVERPKLGNDLYKHPLRIQMVATDPQDGIPRVTTTTTMADSAAPPLEPETFVCMGDESAFVIRDGWGQVLLSVEPSRVRWYQGHGMEGWLAPLSDEERSQARNPDSVLGGEVLWYWVEPLRPQCEHYKRVMTDFEGSDVNKRIERVCSAQRTEGGEYISLGDTRVYACEHRLPRDFVSEQRLKKFDADRVAEGRQAEKFWDGEAALEAALRAEEEDNDNG